MKKLKVVMMMLLVALACGPLNNPQSADYPCGPRGIVCSAHECCWRGDECGGQSNGSISCPDGQCCWVGTPGDGMMVSNRPKQYKMVHVP